MAFRKLYIFLLIFIFILMPFLLFGQEESGSEETNEIFNYSLDYSDGEPRFIQRLYWDGDDFVLRYVLIIEKREDDGRYTETERIDTEKNFAEVSLYAGIYRYRLDVFDLFDEFAFTTDWLNFEVIKAIQPVISNFRPGNFYLDEEEEWIITVRGQNFLPQTVFFLITENSRVSPQNVFLNEVDNTALLYFSGSSLYPGRFLVYARNPGGLESSQGTFTVSNKKPFDFNISIGYAPIFPIMGYLFEDGFIYEERFQEAPFNDAIYPLSAIAKLNFIPVKRTWGNIGVELSGSYSFLFCDRKNYTTSAILLNTHASILYQKHFLKRTLFINLNIGAGLFSLMDFYYDFGNTESEKETSVFISAIGGLSVTYIFKKPWFFTVGVDYIHGFTPPSTDTPFPAVIRPSVLFGVHL